MKVKLRTVAYLTSLTLIYLILGVSSISAAIQTFSGWTVQNWNSVPGNYFANWVVSSDNTSVIQNLNSNPSAFLNGVDKTNYSMQGFFKVDTTTDDDYIGFVFGYQDSTNFYLFNWKQTFQAGTDGVNSQGGFSVKKFSAPQGTNFTNNDFSGDVDTQNMKILASKYGNENGWHDYETYSFYLCHTPGAFQIRITDTSTTLWEITIDDLSFTSGQFGLFNNSQPSAVYFNLEEGPAFCGNTSPTANAGENISISSEEQVNIVLQGFAADPENDSLTFRWLEGTEVLAAGSVRANGEAYLDLSTVPYFSIGEHTLTLEVSDGQTTSTDEMILTVDNSAPHPAPSGGGSYEIGNPVTLAGQISDFDGDLLTYEWLKDSEILFTGSIKALNLGSPVDLPYLDVTNLTLGLHTLTLRVNDGINSPVVSDITVEIIDTSDPTVAPVPNKTILWPPNHKMVDIMIEANAADNSGNPVTLSATVTSNEPVDSLEDEDVAPDWSEPVIDQGNGTIALQLRSERSGSGSGRVYTIAITATDGSGNSSEALVEIIVPHDNGKKK